MTEPAPTTSLTFGLHCSICGADLVFLGAGKGSPGTMERARCWCAECRRGFVLTVTMRAMSPSEEAVERGELPASAAPRLEHEDDGRASIPRSPTNTIRRAARPAIPVELPPGTEHGTRWAYERYECRCDPCTDRQRESKAGQRRQAS